MFKVKQLVASSLDQPLRDLRRAKQSLHVDYFSWDKHMTIRAQHSLFVGVFLILHEVLNLCNGQITSQESACSSDIIRISHELRYKTKARTR